MKQLRIPVSPPADAAQQEEQTANQSQFGHFGNRIDHADRLDLAGRRAKWDSYRAGDGPEADDQSIANDAGHENGPAGWSAQ